MAGLVAESVGALLLGALCLVFYGTSRRVSLVYWAVGWAVLGGALLSLFASTAFPGLGRTGLRFYFFGEYVFGYLVLIGCRLHGRGPRPARVEAWLLVPAACLAALLPLIGGGEIRAVLAAHAAIYACLLLAALSVASKDRLGRRFLAGEQVVKVALVLLAVNYALFALRFVVPQLRGLPPEPPYLGHGSVYDLIFLVLLAFGMVMTVTGDVQHALERAIADFTEAKDRLEVLARFDHLTSALNRHAFYSIIEGPETDRNIVRGCAAFADIDRMKAINDAFGHAAGDDAIRSVASAIRACIRADDLLFRWGGDEFLVLLFGVSEIEARARLDEVNRRLKRTIVPGVPYPVEVRVSVGYAAFDSAGSLDDVIALADSAMYGQKRTWSSATASH